MHEPTIFELKTLEDYSDEALLEEIRRVMSALNDKRLTQQRFREIARVGVTTIRNRFGSWKRALDLAGIDDTIAPRFDSIKRDVVLEAIRLHSNEFPDTSPTVAAIAARLGVHRSTLTGRFGTWKALLDEVGLTPTPLGKRYTDEECFENIVALWTLYGRQPNFAELNQAPSTVGSKAYVLRWGGWPAALGAFIRYVNQPQLADDTPVTTPPQPSKAAPSATPRSISLSLRYKVLRRDHFRCVIYGRSPAKDHAIELHVDHIIPWSKGGQNVEDNLRTLCFDCNLGKGDKLESA